MARHRAEHPEDAIDDDSRDGDLDEELDSTDDDTEATDDDAEEAERPAEVEKFWAKVRVDPIEIALPRGVGYTLRAYRMSDTLDLEESEEPAEDADDVEETGSTSAATSRRRQVDDDEDSDDPDSGRDEDEDLRDREDDDGEDDDREDDDADALEDEDEDEDEEAEEEAEAEPEPEEIPLFLTQDRRLLLFRTPEGLVDFVKSGEATHLQAIDEWDTLQSGLTVDHIVVVPEDRYELDLVVENLRGGHDAWDAELIIKAGEVCRDLGHALRVESVVTALSAGSPLDDLDEALRAAEGRRVGAFFARRRLRKIGAQQAALAWRSIIGKISTSVDWRD